MELSTHEKRASPRKPLHGHGELIDSLSAKATPIDLLDISMGGVSFLSATPQQKEAKCFLHFSLMNTELRGSVRIAYCVKHSLADTYRLGVEFRNWDTDSMATIQNYLNQH